MSETSTEKTSILNNAIVLLAILFTIPALLVVGATLITASYGRVPGGTTTECEQTFGDVTISATLYRYQAGLTPYETQTFFLQKNNYETIEVFKVDIQAPEDFDCATGIQQLDDGTLLISTVKGVGISHDNGATWLRHTVCNPPRPTAKRCDKDPLNIVEIDFEDGQHGRLVVQEAITDEYGVVINDENGQPRIINEYILITDNGGATWTIADA